MVTPSGRSTSMVMVAMAVPDVQESSDLVSAVEQHLPGNVAHRRPPEKPQKARLSHFKPVQPLRVQAEGVPPLDFRHILLLVTGIHVDLVGHWLFAVTALEGAG